MSVIMYEKEIACSIFLLMAMIRNAKAGIETSTVPPLQEVIRTVGLSEGNKVYAASVFGLPLELFIVLILIIGIAVVGAIIVAAIKKAKPTSLEKVLEDGLEDALRVKEETQKPKLPIELTEVKGIGPKRAEKLKAAGVNTVSDLAVSSAKDLSQKTGISEKIISRWIGQAKELIE